MRLFFTQAKYSWNLDHAYDEDHRDGIPHDEEVVDISTISGNGAKPGYASDPYSALETPLEKKLRKRSHWVAYATMFVMTVGFSVVLSGIWPYLKLLDPTKTKESLGWVVAANPLGQMIASPIVGHIGNRMGKIRYVCYFTMTSFIVGNALYSLLPLFADSWDHAGFHLMILARFIVGLSSSNVTLCRSYLASSTTQKERTTGISIVSAAQSLGFVVGPAIQAVLSVTIRDEYLKYQTAGWVAAALGVINFILLTPWIFQEYNISAKEHTFRMGAGDTKDDITIPKTDYVALFGVLFGFFMNQFIYVLLETLMEPFLTDQYSWCDNIAVVISGIIFAFAGILAVIMFIISTRLAKKIDERKILIFCAFVPLSIGVFLFIPWGPGTLKYCPDKLNNYTTFPSSTIITTVPSALASDVTVFTDTAPNSLDIPGESEINLMFGHLYNTFQVYYEGEEEDTTKWTGDGEWVNNFCNTTECYGCPVEQTWCIDHDRLPMAQFLVAYIIVISGYPFGVSMSNSMFSKILGPKPQGFWMGILTASGSFSRVLGPIFVSYLYTNKGTEWTFAVLVAGMLIAIIELTVLYKRIVPMKAIVRDKDDERN